MYHCYVHRMIDGNLQRVLVLEWVTHNQYIAWANDYEAEMATWKDREVPKLKGGTDEELDYYNEIKKKVTEAKQFICVSKEEAY